MDVEAYHIVLEKSDPEKTTVIPFSQILLYQNISKVILYMNLSILGSAIA